MLTAAGGSTRNRLAYRWSNFKCGFRGWLLEDKYHHGLGGPPNNWRYSPEFASRQQGSSTGHQWWALHFGNDAYDVQIATKYSDEESGRWVLFMAAEDFRKLALWYLWRWVWGEWLGLRRRLFYRDLRRRVSRMKLCGK